MHGSLATKLRVLRAERGLTVRQVAELSGVAKETISQVERGERHPYDRTVAKLAHAYEVPVDELLEEPALAGKAKAPDTGQPQPSPGTFEEFEQKLERVLAPARTEALRDEQARNRLLASEGVDRYHSGPMSELEVEKRFLDEFSPEERASAFSEVVGEFARLERLNMDLRGLNPEIAQLEGENALLRQEIALLEDKIAKLEKLVRERNESVQAPSRAEAER